MMHYEYCSPRQFHRLESGETVSLGFRNTSNYKIGDKMLMSIYDPPKDQKQTRFLEATIVSLTRDGLPDGYIALTLRMIWSNKDA